MPAPPELLDAAPSAAFVLIPGAGGAAWYWHRRDQLCSASPAERPSVP
jgi:hypothetical protein